LVFWEQHLILKRLLKQSHRLQLLQGAADAVNAKRVAE
jgi:hypothetical protein